MGKIVRRRRSRGRKPVRVRVPPLAWLIFQIIKIMLDHRIMVVFLSLHKGHLLPFRHVEHLGGQGPITMYCQSSIFPSSIFLSPHDRDCAPPGRLPVPTGSLLKYSEEPATFFEFSGTSIFAPCSPTGPRFNAGPWEICPTMPIRGHARADPAAMVEKIPKTISAKNSAHRFIFASLTCGLVAGPSLG